MSMANLGFRCQSKYQIKQSEGAKQFMKNETYKHADRQKNREVFWRKAILLYIDIGQKK